MRKEAADADFDRADRVDADSGSTAVVSGGVSAADAARRGAEGDATRWW